MSSTVLDSSALLALLNLEPGHERVRAALRAGAAIGAVNFSEVVARLSDAGQSEAEIRAAIDPLALEIVDFDAELAFRAGLLRPATRHAGLSLGDRACLALAERLDLPALTADRLWADLNLGMRVEVIR